ELVDCLVEFLDTNERAEAVRVAEFLQDKGLIAHVLGDAHHFQDTKSPYSFVVRVPRPSESGPPDRILIIQSDQLDWVHFKVTSIIALMDRIYKDEKMAIVDREYRRVIYTDCFLAPSLVSWILHHLPIVSRKEA